MASSVNSLVSFLLPCTIFVAMVDAKAVPTTQSDQIYYNSPPPPAECAYPCLPTPPSPGSKSPPAGPGTYYPPPYYPGPGLYTPPSGGGGSFPFSPPSPNLPAPPPPNPILPYFPFYSKNQPPPLARPLKASLLLVMSLLWFILL